MKKNPLNKRFFRELKGDVGKYAVIFVLLVLLISEVSGYLVASTSMQRAYDESFEAYRIEDGNFTAEKKLNSGQRKRITELGVSVHDLFFTEWQTDSGLVLRIFADREEVNLVCVMEGRLPERLGEIAIDRMCAKNNHIEIGDVISGDGRSYTVTGLVALSDYSALFSDNNDTMFDAVLFGVAVVTPEDFAHFSADSLHYRYAWKYDEAPADEKEENTRSEAFIKELARITDLTGYIPRYLNQAIRFSGTDLGADRAMIEVFLYIVILILAFVFAITTSNTIARESAVIGTLRASGYTRGELVRHYLFLPLFVTLIAACIGNVLGYTILKDWNAGLYYNSYSLTTYTTRWNATAFLETTVLPIVMMLVINLVILTRKLALSPLQFLRRELKRKSKTRALPLNKRIPFFSRFRIRVILQNAGNYAVLLFGILFANFILMFGLMMPSILERYEQRLPENMLCNYQYILQLPAGAVDEEEKLEALFQMMLYERAVSTENTDAEKFSAFVLKSLPEGDYRGEDIMLYGIGENSRYVRDPLPEGAVVISSTFAEKFRIGEGDTFTLTEPYGDQRYDFTVTGVSDYEGAICVFMPKEELNARFDLGKNTFTGYLSDTPIEDIDEAYLGQVIDIDALTKVSRQLDRSLGEALSVMNAFSLVIFVTLIYLMSKTIIEKNAQSISMTKILGYTGGEIGRLYIVSTSVMVVLFVLISLPVGYHVIKTLFRVIVLSKMNGWIPYYIGFDVYVRMVWMDCLVYGLVAILEMFRIRRIPMSEALKNVE
ncbi:MAG: ABC transporter permease [Lachnospiraceae bacterium]|nr:ABC transporter permease [Lachnospiraceae bacterium]